MQWAVVIFPFFFSKSDLIAFVDKEPYGCEPTGARIDVWRRSSPGHRGCWLGISQRPAKKGAHCRSVWKWKQDSMMNGWWQVGERNMSRIIFMGLTQLGRYRYLLLLGLGKYQVEQVRFPNLQFCGTISTTRLLSFLCPQKNTLLGGVGGVLSEVEFIKIRNHFALRRRPEFWTLILNKYLPFSEPFLLV